MRVLAGLLCTIVDGNTGIVFFIRPSCVTCPLICSLRHDRLMMYAIPRTRTVLGKVPSKHSHPRPGINYRVILNWITSQVWNILKLGSRTIWLLNAHVLSPNAAGDYNVLMWFAVTVLAVFMFVLLMLSKCGCTVLLSWPGPPCKRDSESQWDYSWLNKG